MKNQQAAGRITKGKPRINEVEINHKILAIELKRLIKLGIQPAGLLGRDGTKILKNWLEAPSGRPHPYATKKKLTKFIETANQSIDKLNKTKPNLEHPPIDPKNIIIGNFETPHHALNATLRKFYESTSIRGLPASILSKDVPLAKFFVKPNLKPLADRSDRSEAVIAFDRLADRLLNDTQQMLLIGSSGRGKSLLLAALAWHLSLQMRGNIPLLASLEAYTGGPIDEYVIEQLQKQSGTTLELDKVELARQLLKSPGSATCFILLDNLDRLSSDQFSSFRYRLTQMSAGIRIVLVSRPSSMAFACHDFKSYILEPLSVEQIKELGKNFSKILHYPSPFEKLHLSEASRALLSSPLFATFYLTWNDSEPPVRADLVEHMVQSFLATGHEQSGEAKLEPTEIRIIVEELALQMIEKPTAELTRLQSEGRVKDVVRRQQYFTDTITIDAKSKVVMNLLLRSGLLEEEASGRLRWAHEIIRDFMVAGALFRREIHQGGLASLTLFALDHVADTTWREVLLFVMSRNRHCMDIVDTITAAIKDKAKTADPKSWDSVLFLIAMLRDGVYPSKFSALELIKKFWDRCRLQRWPEVEQAITDLRAAISSLRHESATAVVDWIYEELKKRRAEDLERFVLVFVPGDELPVELKERADREEPVWDLLWRLWPSREFITKLNVTERPMPYAINIELVALRCVVCTKGTWPEGASRFVLLLLARMLWTARSTLAKLHETRLPAGIIVQGSTKGTGLPIMLLPAVVPERTGLRVDQRPLSRADEDIFDGLLKSLDEGLSVEFNAASEMQLHRDVVETFTASARQHYPAKMTMHLTHARISHSSLEELVQQAARHVLRKLKLNEDYRGELEWLSSVPRNVVQNIIWPQDLTLMHCSQAPWAMDGGNAGSSLWLHTYGAHALDIIMAALLERAYGDSKSRERFVLPAVRAQNRWLYLFLDILTRNLASSPEINALVLALGLAQYQTTWTWPWGDRWRTLGGPESRQPRDWLPRFVWNLCRAAQEPLNAHSYLSGARQALAATPASVPSVFREALAEGMVRPILPEDLL